MKKLETRIVKKLGKILILGAGGKMGHHYMEKLKNLGILEKNIIGVEINPDNLKKISAKYPKAFITSDHKKALKKNPKAAIIAVNSTAHFQEIERCLGTGITDILCEKPLVYTMEEIRNIEKMPGFVREKLLTAFLINFSGIVGGLTSFMETFDLYVGFGSSRWGKNWPGEGRIMGSDLEEETPHPLGVLLSLIGLNQKIQDVSFFSRLTSFPHNRKEDLAHAGELNMGFPDNLNDATMAEINFKTDSRNVSVHFHTSFNYTTQMRLIELGLFPGNMKYDNSRNSYSDYPPFKAELRFDLGHENALRDIKTIANAFSLPVTLDYACKIDELLGGAGPRTVDILRIIDSRTNEIVLEKTYSGDKIQKTLEAALLYFAGEKRDHRLMGFDNSAFTVDLLQRIAEKK